jgi:hypothetical protein
VAWTVARVDQLPENVSPSALTVPSMLEVPCICIAPHVTGSSMWKTPVAGSIVPVPNEEMSVVPLCVNGTSSKTPMRSKSRVQSPVMSRNAPPTDAVVEVVVDVVVLVVTVTVVFVVTVVEVVVGIVAVDEVVVAVVPVVTVTVVFVVTVVEVVVGTVVLVLDADGHSEKSILQSLVQSNAPPGDGQVKLPKLLPSHCSPGSSTPLPQSAEVVVVVVLVVTVVVGGIVAVVLVVAAVVLVVEVVEVLVVEVVVLVVELVVVVVAPTGQRGRPGSPVQVQRNALHWLIRFFAQLIEGLGPHASLISSLQAVVLSHLPLLSAIAEEETKTPTPSATAAKNVTTAFLVIVEPPYGRSNPKIDFGALPPRGHFSTRLSRGESPPHRTDEGLVRARARSDKPVPADTSAVRCSRARTARSQDTSRRRR